VSYLVGAVPALIAAVASAASIASSGAPDVSTYPAVALRGQRALVIVRGLDPPPSVEVRLQGARSLTGMPFPWRRLQRGQDAWAGVLPRPALRGVYPIELRIGGGPTVLRSKHWLFRVLALGTLSRPSFATPEQVAGWWVRTVPRARLVAMRRWPRPAFDGRDPRLHQLLVVAYSPPGDSRVRDRLGMWITAFRDGYGGRWRLLEATVMP
jgi:hypothetical protein